MENLENKQTSKGCVGRVAGEESAIAGFQPTGDGRLHLGNLLGSAMPFAMLKGVRVKYAMLADVHALSMGSIPEGFKEAKIRMLLELAACGLGDETVLFEQSKVPELLALAQMLAPFAPIGELRRMTQFEIKSRESSSAPLALLGYPCLMAADILGLGAMRVVVGEDQRQHLELARGVSARVKAALGVDYGEPRALELTSATRIKALRNPKAKMSKSDQEESSTIFISDSRDQIIKKIKKAVMDSEGLPEPSAPLDEGTRPGLCNMLAIASGCSGLSIQEILKNLEGGGHARLKECAFESVDAMLKPIRECLSGANRQDVLRRSEFAANEAREVAREKLASALNALS